MRSVQKLQRCDTPWGTDLQDLLDEDRKNYPSQMGRQDKVWKFLHKANSRTIAVVVGGMMTPSLPGSTNYHFPRIDHTAWRIRSRACTISFGNVALSNICARIGWGIEMASKTIIEQMSRIGEAEANPTAKWVETDKRRHLNGKAQ